MRRARWVKNQKCTVTSCEFWITKAKTRTISADDQDAPDGQPAAAAQDVVNLLVFGPGIGNSVTAQYPSADAPGPRPRSETTSRG